VGTIQAFELGGHASKVQLCTFGKSSPGDDIPIKLYRVIYIAGQFPHHNMNIRDPFGICLIGMLQREIYGGPSHCLYVMPEPDTLVAPKIGRPHKLRGEMVVQHD